MNVIKRWWIFNAVGALGAAVQLGALAVLNRVVPGHYLASTAAAVEVTVLHNFAWHQRYTWQDRGEGGMRRRKLVRFHLANGAVSMVGNLVVMRVLVQQGRVPVVAANAIAILACSVANFCLSHLWAFAPVGARLESEEGRA